MTTAFISAGLILTFIITPIALIFEHKLPKPEPEPELYTLTQVSIEEAMEMTKHIPYIGHRSYMNNDQKEQL